MSQSMGTAALKEERNIRWTAILIGILLIPLNSWWIMQMEAVYYSAHSTLFSLFFNTIFNLFLLTLISQLFRQLAPYLRLRQSELLTIYIMLNLSAALVGHSMLQILPPSMAAPLGLATLENEWTQLFGQYIPTWLAVTDVQTLEAYIQGTKSESTLYTARHLRAWVVPVLMWSLFVCVLMCVKLCINVILRKQWMERERLAFPIAQLPFEMTVSGSGLFQNRLFWISFAVVSSIGIINGLHFFFPYVPYLRVRPYNIGQFFTTPPWDAFGYAPLTFRPFMAGLIFLIPLDMSFSCWFFFFFWKAQLLVGRMLGFRQQAEFPEQSTGAYIALCLIALWMARRHILHIFNAMFRLSASENRDSGDTEPLSYNAALWGLIAGVVFILLFCWQAGMTLLAAGVFFALYLMTQIGITRVRAEVGSPIHDLHFAGPEYLMVDAVGTRKLGAANLSILSFFWFLTRAHYSDVMPHQLEGLKLSDRAGFNSRKLVIAMLIATGFGTIAAFWAILDSAFRHSGVIMSWAGLEPFRRLSGWLSHPQPPNLAGMGFFASGLLFGIFLMVMRVRFIWWPFHPAGYAVSSTYGMRDYWSMFLLVWLVKWLILRHGGLKVHRQVLPLFFGMIIGEFAIGGFWALIGIVFRTQTYNFTAWW